jgi:hypothetical protein
VNADMPRSQNSFKRFDFHRVGEFAIADRYDLVAVVQTGIDNFDL